MVVTEKKNNRISVLVMDVDGTLTDGRIYISPQGELLKVFDVKDGYAIAKMLPQNGILPVIISGRTSEITTTRAKELGIEHIYQGVTDKAEYLRAFAAERAIELSQIAGIGDDEPDIPMLRLCGFTACPADAVTEVKDICQYVCSLPGGRGALREFVAFLIAHNQ